MTGSGSGMKSAVQSLRRRLFDFASEPAEITRGGVPVVEPPLKTVAVSQKYEDADRADGVVFVDAVDFLFSGADGYAPKAGDVITTPDGVFVVKPVDRELWRWDDPGKCILRVHAQRSSAGRDGAAPSRRGSSSYRSEL